MSTFGNFFANESRSEYTSTVYQDAFKTTDSNNTTLNSQPSYKDFLTTTLNINQPIDWAKLAPYIALAGVALAFVFALFTRR